MKKLIVLALMSFSAFSFANSYTCETQFGDIQKLEINIYHGDAFITEVASDGTEALSVVTTDITNAFSVELSEWNGYVRTLDFDSEDFILTAADECSETSSVLKCVEN